MLLFVMQAWATSSSSDGSCGTTVITPALPALDDVDVPPDVRPVVLMEGCDTPLVFGLDDTTDAEVPLTVETPFPMVERLVPDAPLTPGETYSFTLETYYGTTSDAVWFTVGDGTTSPPTPATPEIEAEFDHVCQDFILLEARVDLRFPDASEDQRGLLILDSRVDGLDQPGATPVAYTGHETQRMVARLQGGHELCVSARLEDLTGAPVWETEEVCSGEISCPGAGDDGDGVEVDDGGGCGCRGTGGSAGGVVAALALLTVRRRR